MTKAADELAAGKATEAIQSQTAAVEQLDRVFMVVAPFVNLVQKAVAAQEGLIELSKEGDLSTKDTKDTKVEKETKEEKETKDAKDKSIKVEKSGDKAEKKEGLKKEDKQAKKAEKEEARKEKNGDADWAEAAWNQRFISGYGRILPGKAKMELENLDKTPPMPVAPATPATPTAPTNPPNSTPNDAAKAEEQRKDLKRALQAGVDLAPRVEKLSNEAAADLEAAQPAKALPSQEEALKLLK
jgi:hypothetical protein